MTRSRTGLAVLLALPITPLLLVGCADTVLITTPGGVGVTPGGSQDIELARSVIAEGGIPSGEQFQAEGLFSQHDLPLPPPTEPCAHLLCPGAAAVPIDPVDGSGPRMLVQLGFTGGTDANAFLRPPLNLSLVVDVSGSMADSKLDAVRTALGTLADQLREDDRVSLVAFSDSASLLLPAQPMSPLGTAALRSAIDQLTADGGTSIEAGLQLGYGELVPAAGSFGRSDRLMLFTDARPNVDSTSIDSFLGLVRHYAGAGIGISVFGVGLDLGAELAREISQTRGGNSFFLADQDAIARVFDDEFDFIVSPLGYDLGVEVVASPGLVFTGAWGTPLDGPARTFEFGATTLFASARSGGMGVALGADPTASLPESGPAELAEFALSFTPVGSSEPVAQTLDVVWSGGSEVEGQPVAADSVGVLKMAALVDEVLALESGASFCVGTLGREEAVSRVDAAATHLEDAADLLGDAALTVEVLLMRALADNLRADGWCH